MLRRHVHVAVLLVSVAAACRTQPLQPNGSSIAGQWRSAVIPLSPTGQLVKTLEFTGDGRYIRRHESRGAYATQPADAVSSVSSEYGTYLLADAVLHYAADSVRTWEARSGTSLRVAPFGRYIEGPPTDPVVELSSSRLTLRYAVNPGAGYVPVTETFDRTR